MNAVVMRRLLSISYFLSIISFFFALVVATALSQATATTPVTTPVVSGQTFELRSPLLEGSYDFFNATIWAQAVPTPSDLLGNFSLSTNCTRLDISNAPCIVTLEIQPATTAAVGSVILNGDIRIRVGENSAVTIGNLLWHRGILESPDAVVTVASARLRPPSSRYYQQSELLFELGSGTDFIVTGNTIFEGRVPLVVGHGSTVDLSNIHAGFYPGRNDNPPSVSIRPDTAASYSMMVKGNLTVAEGASSSAYDPELYIEANTIDCSNFQATIPAYRYVRFEAHAQPVSWGTNPTISLNRLLARFQLIAPAQSFFSFPAVHRLEAPVQPPFEKYNAVIVWGPCRNSGTCDFDLDSPPAAPTDISSVWILLYARLGISPVFPDPQLAGLFLFSGSSITPKISDGVRTVIVNDVFFGATVSSPALLRYVNLNVTGTWRDSYLANQLLIPDAPINGTEQSRLNLENARLIAMAGSTISVTRPWILSPSQCTGPCGLENYGNVTFFQAWAPHSINVAYDNCGTFEFTGVNAINSFLVANFTGRNLLPESQRSGGTWRFKHPSNNPQKPSVAFNLGLNPYGPQLLAYDFGVNWAFEYERPSTIIFFTNGDYYFRSTSSSVVRYSTWRNANVDINPGSTFTLQTMVGSNFGARDRSYTANSVPTAKVKLLNAYLTSDLSLSQSAQFLVDRIVAEQTNFTSWRVRIPDHSLQIVFANGASAMEGSIFGSPTTGAPPVTVSVEPNASLTLYPPFSTANIPLINEGTVRFHQTDLSAEVQYRIDLQLPFVQTETGTLVLSYVSPVNASVLEPSRGQYIRATHANTTIKGRVGVAHQTGLQPALYNVIRVPRGSTNGELLMAADTMTPPEGYYGYGVVTYDPDAVTEWIGFKFKPFPVPAISSSNGTAPLGSNDVGGGGSAVGGAVGGVLAALAAIGLAIFLVLFLRKRQAKKKEDGYKEKRDLEEGNQPSSTASGNYELFGTPAPVPPKKKKNKKKSPDESSETSEDTPAAHYGAISSSSQPDLDRTVSGIDHSKKLLKEKKKADWQIPFEDLSFEKELGSGAFGSVWKGLWNMAPVAIKQSLLVSATATQQADFEHEARLMTALRPHPNVVQTFGLSLAKDRILLVMEYCARGSLTKYFRKEKNPLTVERKMKIILDLAKGVHHLHRNAIVHRDLAARNVLITKDWTAKISDFGMSRLIGNSENKGTTASNIGPVRWMSPEAIRTKEYSAKTDVWSFGITVWEIFTETEPHADLDMLDAAIKIRDEKATPPLSDAIPESMHELLKKCWLVEPDERPSFDDIVKDLGALVEGDESELSASAD